MESCVVEAFTKTAVDEANREKGEPRSHSEVVVAFTFWLKLVVGDHANVPASVPQVITPFVSALRSQLVLFRPDTTREEEDAVPETARPAMDRPPEKVEVADVPERLR